MALFDPVEVAAIYEVPLTEMFKIFNQKDYNYLALGRELCSAGYKDVEVAINRNDFIPTIDTYPYWVAIHAERYINTINKI